MIGKRTAAIIAKISQKKKYMRISALAGNTTHVIIILKTNPEK